MRPCSSAPVRRAAVGRVEQRDDAVGRAEVDADGLADLGAGTGGEKWRRHEPRRLAERFASQDRMYSARAGAVLSTNKRDFPGQGGTRSAEDSQAIQAPPWERRVQSKDRLTASTHTP